MKRIPIRYRGSIIGFALVDDGDYASLSGRRWSLGTAGYPEAKIGGRRSLIHRVILGLVPGDGICVDHINRDKFDNQRANLRTATLAENNQNRVRQHGRSGFRGVALHANGKWRAYASLGGKQFHLGHFENEADAAQVAAAWRAEHMPFSSDARSTQVAA